MFQQYSVPADIRDGVKRVNTDSSSFGEILEASPDVSKLAGYTA